MRYFSLAVHKVWVSPLLNTILIEGLNINTAAAGFACHLRSFLSQKKHFIDLYISQTIPANSRHEQV